MSWCESCQLQVQPADAADGSCPNCSAPLAGARRNARIPWHFWVLVMAAGGYLAFRGVEGLAWLVGLLS